ncbi:MAG: hypothetical protein ABI724_11890 [Betaproteobacteria bacterium]
MSEGAAVMANQRSALSAISRYEDFLFAPICDEPSGMRLSVISALARMNVDPWEEAARLATLSTPDARESLVSTLNLFPGNRQQSAETEVLAARLVALLPKADEPATANASTSAAERPLRNMLWLAWVCFAIAMSLLSPHPHGTTTSAEDSAPTANATPPTEGTSVKPDPSAVGSRPDSGNARPQR